MPTRRSFLHRALSLDAVAPSLSFAAEGQWHAATAERQFNRLTPSD